MYFFTKYIYFDAFSALNFYGFLSLNKELSLVLECSLASLS